MKKVKFAYNPSSGESEVAARLDDIIAVYQKRGLAIVPYRLDFKGNPHDIIDDLDNGDYNHILVAGGDGTVNYIVNLLKRNNLDIPVAVLPTGPSNDFAHLLGVTSWDIIRNCENILNGVVREIDLGLADNQYFVNVFSCGLFTDVSQKTPTIMKNTFGKLAYYVGGIGELTRFRKMNISIKSDGGDYEGPCVIFFVFNGRTAGRMRIAYLSEIDDGLLDVLIIKGDNPILTIRMILRYITRIGSSKHYPPGVVHIRCRELYADCQQRETTDIDGQPGPDFPVHIKCEAASVKMLVPEPKR